MCLILTRHTEIYVKCQSLQPEAWFKTRSFRLPLSCLGEHKIIWTAWPLLKTFFLNASFFWNCLQNLWPILSNCCSGGQCVSLDLILEIAKMKVTSQINNQLGYISYILSCVKSSQNSAAESNKCLLYHNIWRSGTQRQLSWVVLTQPLIRLQIRYCLGLWSHLKAWLGLKDPLPRSLTWLWRASALHGLWDWELNFSHCGLSRRAVWMSSKCDSWLPPETMMRRREREREGENKRERERISMPQSTWDRRHGLLLPYFGSYILSLLGILLVTQANSGPVTKYEVQEAILGEAGYALGKCHLGPKLLYGYKLMWLILFAQLRRWFQSWILKTFWALGMSWIHAPEHLSLRFLWRQQFNLFHQMCVTSTGQISRRTERRMWQSLPSRLTVVAGTDHTHREICLGSAVMPRRGEWGRAG